MTWFTLIHWAKNIENHLSKEERNTGEKQKDGGVEAQPAENVNKTVGLHRGLSLLFWEVQDDGKKWERDTWDIVEEEV